MLGNETFEDGFGWNETRNEPPVRSSECSAGVADPLIICSECEKHITEGTVLFWGEPDIGKPMFCSVDCAKRYKPDVLTRAKLSSIFGRWRRKTEPNEKLSDGANNP